MGLQRKPGEVVQEGQQFDIRGSIDAFKHSLNMYMFWKPGMEIYVSHVRRKQLPAFVFPDGYRRPRQRILNQHPVEKSSCEEGMDRTSPVDRHLKRKKDVDEVDLDQNISHKRQSVSPQKRDSVSPGCPSPELCASSIDQKILSSRLETGSASCSSVVTTQSSEVNSSRDVGWNSVGGCMRGNMTADGITNQVSSLSDSCESDSQPLKNDCAFHTDALQKGLQVELKVFILVSLNSIS